MDVSLIQLRDKMRRAISKPTGLIERKLKEINYSDVNKGLANQILIEVLVLGILYSIYCYYYFNGLWYLNMLIVISTMTFIYNYIDIRLELIHKKISTDIPNTTNKMRYYLKHTKNIEMALSKTEKRSPGTTKSFVVKLNDAVRSENYTEEIDKIKDGTNAEWVKIICTLVKSCKVHGNKDGVIGDNFKKTTSTINFINIQRGLDNSAILGIQIFVFFLPIFAIPGIKMFSMQMMSAFEQSSSTGSIEGQIKIAKIILQSNVCTLILSWIRKNN